MINRKRVIAITIVFALTIVSVTGFASENLKKWINPSNSSDVVNQANYDIYVNGSKLDMIDPATGQSQPVININGRTYLPVRKVAEATGSNPDTLWNGHDVTINTPQDHSTSTDFVQINFFPNGQSVEESLAVNQEVKDKAFQVTSGYITKEGKAKALYNWVIAHMTYDESAIGTGAQAAYNTGKGVCYEFSTLYAAMADSINLNVRIETAVVTDNNKDFVGLHAYNQYQDGAGQWINVDCTWGSAGGSESLGWDFHANNSETEGAVANARYPTQLIAEFENY